MLFLNKFSTFICILLVVFSINACSGTKILAPLTEQSVIKAKPQLYIVASGDTLYSIAFLSGLDYRELAAWNQIDEPFLIRRGQKINLVKPDNYKKSKKAAPPLIDKPYQIQPVSKRSGVTFAPAKVPDPGKNLVFNKTWIWPVSSRNILNYKSLKQNKGIDIITRHGMPVHASAAGKVVYAGSGLKGYGNLVIIKHNENYLSAYAHNKSINVKEGQAIYQGQQIAKIGHFTAQHAKLHFEIRKNGKPLNPLGLLPKKVG